MPASRIKFVVFDFDGVFTDNRVLVHEDGSEAVFCDRSDGFGLDMLRNAGIEIMVISTETNPVVLTRCRKLKLRAASACSNKLAMLRKEASRLGVSLEETAYMGNDINDLECLKSVGFPACVADSYPDVLAVSRYITKKPGGHGAVREFCEYIRKQEL